MHQVINMDLLETLNRLKALKLNLEVHPDNEPDSEFEGRISDLENSISSIGETVDVIQEFVECFNGEYGQLEDYKERFKLGSGLFFNKYLL